MTPRPRLFLPIINASLLLYSILQHQIQDRIKGFLGSRHFSSLGPLEDTKSNVGTTVYSRLPGLMEGEGYTDN
jgi:hypothetical protein